jgi:predicted phosphodiesterase
MNKNWNDEIEKAIRKLILRFDNWADVTEEVNSKFNLNISVSALKSYSYRKGITFPPKDKKFQSRLDIIQSEYNIFSEDDVPTFSIQTKEAWIPIWLLGDMHIGSDCFDEDAFMNWALKNNAYLIGLGDWMETAIPSHMPKTVFAQQVSPDNQKKYTISMMLPFKNKTITIVDGNHEKRVSDATSYKPLEDVAVELGSIHMAKGGIVCININGIGYTVLVKHGSSFAKNNLELKQWGEIYKNVDVIVSGHIHTCEAFTMNEGFEIVNGKKVKTRQVGVRCGHYLSYKGYVEEKPLKPLESESMVLWLNTKTKEIMVSKIRSNYNLV